MSITAEKIARRLYETFEPGARHSWERAADDVKGPYFIEARAILSLLQQGEPEGWKLLRDMRDYIGNLTNRPTMKQEIDAFVLLDRYDAMLSASPLPPAPGAETIGSLDRDSLYDQTQEAEYDENKTMADRAVDFVEGVESGKYIRPDSSRQAVLEDGMNEAARIVDRHAAEAENLNLTLLPSGLRAIAKAIRGAAIRSRTLATTPPAEGERK